MTARTPSPEDDAVRPRSSTAQATPAAASEGPSDAGREPKLPRADTERPHASKDDIRKLLDLMLGDE